MAGVITRGAHPKALWPGVRKFVMAAYAEHPAEYSRMFDVKSSTKAYEEDVQVRGFPLPSAKAEGAATVYTDHQQGYVTRYTHLAYSQGYIVTYEEIQDNQYKDRSFKRGAMLARSFRVSKETVAQNVLNRAFSGSYLGGDGVAMVSTAHPTLSGNQSNRITVNADLSEASLEDLLTQIRMAREDVGHPIQLRGQALIVHPSEEFNAHRILKSTLQNDTANNAINVIKAAGMLPGGIVVGTYLTDTDAWFIKTDAPDGMIMFERQAFEFDTDNDFDTKNAKAKGYERFSVGWTDWRGCYGSEGA